MHMIDRRWFLDERFICSLKDPISDTFDDGNMAFLNTLAEAEQLRQALLVELGINRKRFPNGNSAEDRNPFEDTVETLPASNEDQVRLAILVPLFPDSGCLQFISEESQNRILELCKNGADNIQHGTVIKSFVF